MRAIIINDDDCKGLLDQLRLEKFLTADEIRTNHELTPDEIHRRFHYRVVTWLQSHGARLN